MSDADRAFRIAEERIERARAKTATSLDFDAPQFRALDRLPPAITALTQLERLYLDNTQITDLTPLRGLHALKSLDLSHTQVADLAPLKSLPALKALYLGDTLVTDFAPLQGLTALESLSLANTPVTDLAPLQDLSALEWLQLNQTPVTDLTPLQGLSALRTLFLTDTPVSDLGPLQGLSLLEEISINFTQVTDLNPLQDLSALQKLHLVRTQVTDLRPIANLPRLGEGRVGGLWFDSTPAARATPELARLSQIEDAKERTRETLAYLRALPPWPEPLPWETPDAQAQAELDFADDAPLTVTALLESQDLAGWRFSPDHGNLVLHVQQTPTDARQQQLAKMAAERAAQLRSKLGDRTNAGGIRQDVSEEVDRFNGVLHDDTRPLSVRSLELWGSLVALGSLLEANDQGRRDGRDPLDLLSAEARASMQTFLGVAASLVRSFPEARELDDDHGAFDRRGVTPEMLLDMFEAALKAAFIDDRSAALVQHVARLAGEDGQQAAKAGTVTLSGSKNLVLAAALIGAVGIGGGATKVGEGILTDIGSDISDHYELGEKAIAFLESGRAEIDALLDQLSPDETARLRSMVEDALRDAETARTPGHPR